MDSVKIGNFIKYLRKDKKLSQQELSDMIPIDRSVLSKWERGILIPPVDKMKILCNIFNISIDELISGEKNNKKNIKEHEDNLFDYLINKDNKYRKIKMISIISITITIIILFLFLIYYFFQTFDTEKIYKVYTNSNDYVINNGLLVLTRENSYLKIGGINDEIKNISLIYKDNDNEKLIFSGLSDYIIVDFSGYDGAININNFNELKDNLFIKVDDELIKLYFANNYKNNNLILKDSNKLDIDRTNKVDSNNIIPDLIKDNFECDDNICNKEENNMSLYYDFENNIFYINDNDVYVQFFKELNLFSYKSSNLEFSLDNGNLNCYSDKCNNYLNEYNKYYINIIRKYID